MTKAVQTPLGEMWPTDDGIPFHRIDEDLTISSGDAAAVQGAVLELTGGRPVPAVVDIRAVGYAERAARDMFGASTEETSESATALIVGSTASWTMAKAFMAMGPTRPIEVFTSESETTDWARSRLSE